MIENDRAPSWAMDMKGQLGELIGKVDSLHTTFQMHIADDKITAGKVEVIERQMVAMMAASGAKAKIWASLTHTLTSFAGAALTIAAKKFGVWH